MSDKKDDQKQKVELKGRVKNIVFRNEENGYTVLKLQINDDQKNEEQTKDSKKKDESYIVSCIGYLAEINKNDFIKVMGYFSAHQLYGEQFRITSIERKIELTEENIIKYLSSGIVKGIGPKIAERIVEIFGLKTFEVIEDEDNYRNLIIVRGVNENLASKLHKKFIELNKNRNTILFLQSLDIFPSDILKIQKKYGDNVIDAINVNPYRLTDEINGFGFRKADAIAEKIGIEKTSLFRIQSAIKFCLQEACEKCGHIYLPKDRLIDDVVNLIESNSNDVEENVKALESKGILYCEVLEDGVAVYISVYYYIEKFIAMKILDLRDSVDKFRIDVNVIKDISHKNKIDLASEQIIAVKEALENGVTIITGGPGTGKTTILKIVVKILYKFGIQVELCAPTGRAAKRMSEATQHDAKTIHRLLGINFVDNDNSSQKFEFNENNPIRTNYIIIDEASMIDIFLMFNLLKAISSGTKLILVGDVDQLPSVGPGNILKDMIDSKQIKNIKLVEVFRQAQKSSIVINAHCINQSKPLCLNKKDHHDFFFINVCEPDVILKIILELVINRIPKLININDLFEIQVLAPMKRSVLGSINLNRLLQAHINPPSKEKKEKSFGTYIFREGDKVMQIKNNYSLEWFSYVNNICVSNGRGVFNGDIGFIQEINDVDGVIKIKFDDNKLVNYSFMQLEELDLAYAITIHKSQGSEYKAVVIPIFNGPPILMNKNLLYTAVTRAKELVVIIGQTKILYAIIKNKKTLERFSRLSFRIKEEVYKNL
jgi:exodeoxyribonuclease V alpha subunit